MRKNIKIIVALMLATGVLALAAVWLGDWDTGSAIPVVYVALGGGLLWLSVWIVKRFRSGTLRSAIYAGIFALWFSPGILVGEGGVGPAPLWYVFIVNITQYLFPRGEDPTSPSPVRGIPDSMGVCIIVLATVWVVAFAVTWLIVTLRQMLKRQPLESVAPKATAAAPSVSNH
jgi:hypothetical protein